VHPLGGEHAAADQLGDVAAAPSQDVKDDETEILSLPVRLHRAGREIRMVIDSTNPFAAAKPDARLIKLLLRARRFNATLAHSEGVPRCRTRRAEGVSRSYFTRLVRLSYLRRISRKPSSMAGSRAI
jgi:site-specific DNA recombinase